ncbi:hypothetical protein EXIGLDRAFT_702194 [Exidia glandulosa HHB12029]|uniref:Uncharacterized protein n=1 Tax=Exidia glandulosa HHB12029 TaxID=1314781 RepID=A0A165ZHM7_EXIGL|nr:hypothetical protein EXIGLDRAFT_702194 [Exidia glandulosa HHB12029]
MSDTLRQLKWDFWDNWVLNLGQMRDAAVMQRLAIPPPRLELDQCISEGVSRELAARRKKATKAPATGTAPVIEAGMQVVSGGAPPQSTSTGQRQAEVRRNNRVPGSAPSTSGSAPMYMQWNAASSSTPAPYHPIATPMPHTAGRRVLWAMDEDRDRLTARPESHGRAFDPSLSTTTTPSYWTSSTPAPYPLPSAPRPFAPPTFVAPPMFAPPPSFAPPPTFAAHPYGQQRVGTQHAPAQEHPTRPEDLSGSSRNPWPASQCHRSNEHRQLGQYAGGHTSGQYYRASQGPLSTQGAEYGSQTLDISSFRHQPGSESGHEPPNGADGWGT